MLGQLSTNPCVDQCVVVDEQRMRMRGTAHRRSQADRRQVGQLHQRRHVHQPAEPPTDINGVADRAPERHRRRDVAVDRRSQIVVELLEVLVGQHHGQSELATLGEHIRERASYQTVGLVDDDGERTVPPRALKGGRADATEIQEAE